MLRGYLWEDLPQEVEAEFRQAHPLNPDLLITFATVDYGYGEVADGWKVDDWGAHAPVRKPLPPKPPRVLKGRENWKSTTESVRDLRARRKAGGLCIDCGLLMDPKSKNYCPKHREADRLRAEEKRNKRMEAAETKKKLPDDREGKRVHFKILVREDQQDDSVTVREADGYLTMNFMPDGKSLREIFVTVGKAGSSDAMYDEWAKQVSNRLQEGATVEQVFKPHRGTIFGDHGYLATPIDGITKCSSVLDLIAQIIIGRFGTKEAVLGTEVQA